MDELTSRQVFARNLQYYMDVNGKTRRDMCKLMGVSFSTYSSWVNGERFPRIESIDTLTKVLNCTREDLMSTNIVDEEEKPTGENTDEPFANLSEEARKFLVVFEKLTPDQKEQLYRLALTIVGEAPQPL